MTIIKEKTIMVTGANSGIGKAVSMQLAELGATVVMMCRNKERGEAALREIRSTSGNTKTDLILVDMASQVSVRNAVSKFLEKYTRLDVLIHNAATFDLSQKKPVMTEDGIESVFATNHVNIVLMTELLLDTLKESAPSRIITVASKGLLMHPFLDIEFDNFNGEKKFSVQHAYYHSKQAQVMFTFDLAERLKGTGVTVNCVRVGNVAIPLERLSHLPNWMLKLYEKKRQLALTPEKMAETYVWLAIDPAVEGITGGYFDEDNKQVKANKNAYDRKTQQRLWEATKTLIRET